MIAKKQPLRWARRPSPLTGSVLRRGDITLALVSQSREDETWRWSFQGETGTAPSEDRAKSAALCAVRRRGL